MIRPASSVPGRTLAAAILLAATVGLFAPDEAQASCGDWLMSSGSHNAEMAVAHDASRPTAPATPCHGPECSRGDDAPVAPVPEITAELERWACLSERLAPQAPLPDAVPDAPRGGPAEIWLCGIFRPPR